MSTCQYNEPSINRGIYIDPSVQVLPMIACTCCRKPVQLLGSKVKKQLAIGRELAKFFAQIELYQNETLSLVESEVSLEEILEEAQTNPDLAFLKTGLEDQEEELDKLLKQDVRLKATFKELSLRKKLEQVVEALLENSNLAQILEEEELDLENLIKVLSSVSNLDQVLEQEISLEEFLAQLKINDSLDQVFEKLNVRGCCRAAIFNDVVVSGPVNFFNPQREAGLISAAKAREEYESGAVYTNWRGHMKRTGYKVQEKEAGFYAVDRDTGKEVSFYEPAEGERVVEWLEIPIPPTVAALQKKSEDPNRPNVVGRILVPRLSSKVSAQNESGRKTMVAYEDPNIDPALLSEIARHIRRGNIDPALEKFIQK